MDMAKNRGFLFVAKRKGKGCATETEQLGSQKRHKIEYEATIPIRGVSCGRIVEQRSLVNIRIESQITERGLKFFFEKMEG
ncbi:unnamed protein product, partial [Ilex paraguariensis]